MRVADSIASPLLKPISVGPTNRGDNANNGDYHQKFDEREGRVYAPQFHGSISTDDVVFVGWLKGRSLVISIFIRPHRPDHHSAIECKIVTITIGIRGIAQAVVSRRSILRLVERPPWFGKLCPDTCRRNSNRRENDVRISPRIAINQVRGQHRLASDPSPFWQ